MQTVNCQSRQAIVSPSGDWLGHSLSDQWKSCLMCSNVQTRAGDLGNLIAHDNPHSKHDGFEIYAVGGACTDMGFAYAETDEAQSMLTLQHTVKLGVTFFDTSGVYGPCENEELAGPRVPFQKLANGRHRPRWNPMILLPIADSHVHFWDLERHRYPWLEPKEPSGPFGKTAAIRKTFLLDDYLADATHQNVVRMVHVEAGWDPSDFLGEMRWIQAVADERGAPHAHMAHIDLAAENARELIEQHAAFPLFRGVRDRLQAGDFTQSDGSKTRIDDPAWRAGLRALEEHGLVFDLQAPPAIAEKSAALARDYPGVRFVLTHAGYPPSPVDKIAFARWRDGLSAMAEAPNVAIKLSGLMLGEKLWQPDHARQAAEALIAAFGPDRVMVASNSPVDLLFAPLTDLFSHYRSWLSTFPLNEQCKMLYDNTCRIYDLGE